MNPVKDVWNLVAMPMKAVFVVGLCGLINWMTFAGTWWVKWVALGMGIATVVAVARGLPGWPRCRWWPSRAPRSATAIPPTCWAA